MFTEFEMLTYFSKSTEQVPFRVDKLLEIYQEYLETHYKFFTFKDLPYQDCSNNIQYFARFCYLSELGIKKLNEIIQDNENLALNKQEKLSNVLLNYATIENLPKTTALSEEANSLSKEANKTNSKSLWVSIVSIAISILSIVLSTTLFFIK